MRDSDIFDMPSLTTQNPMPHSNGLSASGDRVAVGTFGQSAGQSANDLQETGLYVWRNGTLKEVAKNMCRSVAIMLPLRTNADRRGCVRCTSALTANSISFKGRVPEALARCSMAEGPESAPSRSALTHSRAPRLLFGLTFSVRRVPSIGLI
jgi:hypothetical protein